MPREASLVGITHPEMLDGRRIWLDPEVRSLIDRLHFGDATLGWAGDERLALYRTEDKRWELWRLESDGEYRRVARSAPGQALDNRLIMHLVAHDMRKGYDPHLSLSLHNSRLEKSRDEAAAAAASEALERVYYGARRDVGHHY